MQPEFCNRIYGMLMASAIADAMAGPVEGRSTQVTQKFLKQGNWIDYFSPYTPWFQHHWNVYQRHAPAGTFTDDTRLRLMMSQFMIDNAKSRLTKLQLAKDIFSQYFSALQHFRKIDDKWKAGSAEAESIRRERFLHLRFCWEMAKTATEVIVPPEFYSPPYERINDKENYPDYCDQWHLEPVAPQKITENIKSSYHYDTYARGEEMPLGLIALLPFAIYFPGRPKEAFHYIREIDFFDIKNAWLYPAIAVALIADLLGGKNWQQTIDTALEKGLAKYVHTASSPALLEIQNGIEKAIVIAREHKKHSGIISRKEATSFIFSLHQAFGKNDTHLCTPQEMLFVPVALVEYAQDDLDFVIELGVNYGRDNDTAASIAAAIAGACRSSKSLNRAWIKVVANANRQVDIKNLAEKLCQDN